MIARGIVLRLALAQLVAWGVSYYLIGVFGTAIAADLGWGAAEVHGGFALGLAVTGLAAPFAGRLVDRHGGRWVMIAGAVAMAAGCLLLAAAQGPLLYVLAWICLGLAMSFTLYDAAFATLARIGGRQAGPAMSAVTLLGGLSSSLFWPLGQGLMQALGWRGAVVVYALLALATLPLHLGLPAGHGPRPAILRPVPAAHTPPIARTPLAPAMLYALIMAVAAFLAAGMAAHMIAILAGLGLGAQAAVWVAAARGVGQSAARLCEVATGGRSDAKRLNLIACLLLPPAFAACLAGGGSVVAALGFSLAYGAGNGLLTITRGTLPLVLFDPRRYGLTVGRLIAPGFAAAAVAPVAYAAVMARWGAEGALVLSLGLGLIAGLAALLLFRVVPRPA
ncbi:MFS transporter [Tistrella mobilis]|uniref:MFS transporter n=1 Tax=Tistrella mobilis TaxID=171437 RepID=UPI003557EC00